MRRFSFGSVALLVIPLLMHSSADAQSFSIGGGGVGIQFGTGGGYGPGYYGPGYRGYGPAPYRGYGPNYYGRSRSSVGIYLGPQPYYYGYGSNYYGGRSYGYGDNYGYRRDSRQYIQPAPNRSEYTPAPRFPSDDILAVMNWRELGLVLREASGQLRDELQPLPTGPGWQAYLKLGTLNDRFATDSDGPPESATVEELQDILAKYDSAADNPQYDTITRKPSFQAIRSALVQFTEPALERTSRRLTQFHEDLESSLDELATGAGWKQHLALPPLDDAQAVGQAFARYQAVEANEAYRAIANLAPFPATLDTLAELDGLLTDSSIDGDSDDNAEQVPPLPMPEQ